ncbi:(d)CMP kinase [Promicromonospora sukumoe]|uniref:(d)CMP kinase n=1 Tax=Promicromonospora sukumoe TaxID=88382 RepID=UPI0003A2BC74|nr:(d)CMP kinase [Promicromonospora sukumoe]
MTSPVVIAIDGPSGSGKSSVSKAVAARLGLAYLDTGAMYRAATVWSMETADLADAAAVTAAVGVMPLVMGLDPEAPGVELDGRDVAEVIRTTEVTTNVSKVASNLDVRAELKRLQRAIIDQESGPAAVHSGGRGIVAEGRDITTVVAPDADVRVLLTASEEARLRRRSLEVHGAADETAVEATKDQIVRRDQDDAKVTQFLVAADGVVTVDSSDLDFEQTVDAVLAVVAQAQAAASTV